MMGRWKTMGRGPIDIADANNSTRTARSNKPGVPQADVGELSEVSLVDQVAENAERDELEREAVDDEQQQVDGHDGVDQVRQHALRRDRVLLHQLGEIVQARCWARRRVCVRASERSARVVTPAHPSIHPSIHRSSLARSLKKKEGRWNVGDRGKRRRGSSNE